MIAGITGASSGIGKDMAIYLHTLGHDVILIARDEQKLQQLQKQLQSKGTAKVDVLVADLSIEEECMQVYDKAKQMGNIDIWINDAGFGLFGSFVETDLERDIEMIHTNVRAVHILTKLVVQDMIKRNQGYILNVASVAGFLPGPLMATYYATKNYVFRLSEAIRRELKKQKSSVKISVLCPGPVNTNFNQVANVKFNLKQRSSKQVAEYAISHMLHYHFLIMPGIEIKFARFFSKIVPDFILEKVCYHMQEKKKGL